MKEDIFTKSPPSTGWGPFIKDTYTRQTLNRTELAIAGTVFSLANLFGLLAASVAIKHTRASRKPLKSHYIWMIWLELAASVVINVECLLYLLCIIPPSFYFYISILLNWSIQIQLLLQIIINRIRVILDDKERGRQLIIGTAVIVTLINISVFCIWIPARLQISERWMYINNIWDHIEKGIYLTLDGCLNYYFVRVVKKNLVKNGLEKYNHLVRFNQRIIVVSLLMDVMIIGAMSFSNSFVYAIFHPLAYLVKLNIELSMAELIKKVALGNPGKDENLAFMLTFGSAPTGFRMTDSSISAEPKPPRFPMIRGNSDRTNHSSTVGLNEIRKTKEFVMQSTPQPDPDQLSLEHVARSWIERVEDVEASRSSSSQSTSDGDGSAESGRPRPAVELEIEDIVARMQRRLSCAACSEWK